MRIPFPHEDWILLEIREIFRNIEFEHPEECLDPLLWGEILPRLGFTICQQGPYTDIHLDEDWRGGIRFAMCRLDTHIPNKEHFRNWLYDVAYQEVTNRIKDISHSVGIEIPWPKPRQTDAIRHLHGRPPLYQIANLYRYLSLGGGQVSVITGEVGSGKTSLGLRFLRDSMLWERRVCMLSTNLMGSQVRQMMASLWPELTRMPEKLITAGRLPHLLSDQLKAIESMISTQYPDVMFIDTNRVLKDQPKRLVMDSCTELIWSCLPQKTLTDGVLQAMEILAKRTVGAFYQTHQPNRPFTILKHRNVPLARIQPILEDQFTIRSS